MNERQSHLLCTMTVIAGWPDPEKPNSGLTIEDRSDMLVLAREKFVALKDGIWRATQLGEDLVSEWMNDDI